MGIPQQHLRTLHRTGTGAARGWAPSSPTPAPPVTRSTPSAGPMETGAQALWMRVVIRQLHQVQALRLRNLERNQVRNQAKSQERNPGRSQERSPQRENQERNQVRSLERSQERSQERNQGSNQERNQERNLERSQERNQERSQEKERNQTKVEQEQRILLNVDAKQLNFIGQITNKIL